MEYPKLSEFYIIREIEIKKEHDSIAVTGISSVNDVESFWPGFKAVWKQLKSASGTRQRSPKKMYFTEESKPFHPLDTKNFACRFVVDLETSKLSEKQVYVSHGTTAMLSKGEEQSIENVPKNMAILDCEYHDYYQTFSIRVQVSSGTLAKLLHPKQDD